jgi:hypothetical protein
MKFMIAPALALVVAVGWGAAPAEAAGCLKGAAVGGVAGHVAGHHGVLGAGAGCVIGHHEANKHAKQNTQNQQNANGNSGSSTAPAH